MRNSPATRIFFGVLFLVFIAVMAYFYWLNGQTEYAYVYKTDIPAFTFISSETEQLERITVPKNRDFEVVSDPRTIVGMYVGEHPVFAGHFVRAEHLIPELPTGQRRFDQGLLPVGTTAYQIILDEDLGRLREVYKTSDWVNLMAIVAENEEQPSPSDMGVLVFQKARALELTESGLWVALTPEQIAAYEGWKRQPFVRAFQLAVTQPANPDLPALSQYPLNPDYGNETVRETLFGVPTPTPEPLLSTPAAVAPVDDDTATVTPEASGEDE
jgi:hypothetical protein